MSQYKTPDVYVKERSLLGPSVAEVATAIPAFIGYTAFTKDSAGNLITQKPYRLTSMLEYEARFGGKYLESMDISCKQDSGEFYLDYKEIKQTAKYFLYQAVAQFFANGGGTCYIISLGDYDTTMDKAAYLSAIELLKKVDEVTLISCPESVKLDAQNHYDIQNAALSHAEQMMDRFALVDVQCNNNIIADAASMRNKVTQGLKYGAAYYPYLKTSTPRSYDENKVIVALPPMVPKLPKLHESVEGYYAFDIKEDNNTKEIQIVEVNQYGFKMVSNETTGEMEPSYQVDDYRSPIFVKFEDRDLYLDLQGYPVDHENIETLGQRLAGENPYGIFASGGKADKDSKPAEDDTTKALDWQGYAIDNAANSEGRKVNTGATPAPTLYKHVSESNKGSALLSKLNDPDYLFYSTAYYNQVKALLATHYLVLPPSAAIAGIMAKTDAQRGVWKAPANVALVQVIAPTVDIDNSEQEDLNVDTVAGKSINAIRSFVGKGTLVWGARTLDGNSNEWRYVPVRRLFNMVEESVKKASYFAV
ncbi:phage tail sheath subtilisin-like domain-containing protein, partial [Gynuella sp.]|uniref:phage tail sheath subtilisin-like domain-containing protein n=1 Tax=Gynuella sp. TaxID=2969146 RepID=UPI003D0F2A90